jgi:hypothetical protein
MIDAFKVSFHTETSNGVINLHVVHSLKELRAKQWHRLQKDSDFTGSVPAFVALPD